MKRRAFIDRSSLSLSSLLISPKIFSTPMKNKTSKNTFQKSPYVLSTWNVPSATQEAGIALEQGANALDAAVLGVAVEEANILNTTVGIGGAPDRDGVVSLDACVMNHEGNGGAVVAVENIIHVAALAKDVMEHTPHVILASKGAQKFALDQGYTKENLLSESSKKAWLKWLEKGNYNSEINIENHDTIGMLCSDGDGNLSGACTTSGLAYKMHGRVGDSPILGSGLFIDNEVGSAVATGVGEEVLKTVGSFLVVELMRQGKTPQEACEIAIGRILSKQVGKPNFQVAYIATDKKGEIGAFSIQKGFSYTQHKNKKTNNVPSNSAF